jgi:lipopolysaccharide transport system ATP-binding protein
MSEVAQGGRTVLFVSHNMPAVSSFCSAALLLDRGRVTRHGWVDDVLAAYLGDKVIAPKISGRHLDACVAVEKTDLMSGPAVTIKFDIVLRGPLREPRIGIGINDSEGRRIATVFSETAGKIPPIGNGRTQTVRIATEPARFSPGLLTIKIALAERGQDIETHDEALRIIVPEYMPFSRSPASPPTGPIFLKAHLSVHEELSPLEA